MPVAFVALLAPGCQQAPSAPSPTRPEPEAHLRQWDLPEDLPAHLAHLDRLTLSGPIDEIRWLSHAHLQALSLRGTSVRDLTGLPRELQELDICATPVDKLPSLPEHLEILDLRETALQGISGLPASLTWLLLGSRALTRFVELPPSLETLDYLVPKTGRIPKLPKTLRTLALENLPLVTLPSLPPKLTSLALLWTGLESVEDLPESIEHLALLNNERLDEVTWPGQLRTVYLDKMRDESLSPTPRYLEYLSLWNLPAVALGPWSDSVEALELQNVAAVDWGETPLPNLRALKLVDSPAPKLLPKTLEVLELSGETGLDPSHLNDLPPVLASLAIQYPMTAKDEPPLRLRLKHFQGLVHLKILTRRSVVLEDLPEGLRTLWIEGAATVELPPLPRTLRRLVLNQVRLPDQALSQSLSGASRLQTLTLRDTRLDHLPRLPETLEQLDLTGTGIHDLSGLPQGLTSLTITRGAVTSLQGLPMTVRTLGILDPRPEEKCRSAFEILGWKPR